MFTYLNTNEIISSCSFCIFIAKEGATLPGKVTVDASLGLFVKNSFKLNCLGL